MIGSKRTRDGLQKGEFNYLTLGQTTFTTNATTPRTLTFPNNSGTVALLSDIGGGGGGGSYVDLTTNQSISGTKTFNTSLVIGNTATFQLNNPSGQNCSLAFLGASNISVSLPNNSGQLALTSQLPTNSSYVDLSTNQSITGVKTFSSAPVISTIINTGTLTLPTTTGTLALTSQIPTNSTFVDLTTAQTITGVKTFSSAPVISTITNTGTLTLPTTTGTLALTSQIPTNSTYVDLTTPQTIAAVKTFQTNIVFSNGGNTLAFDVSSIASTGSIAFPSVLGNIMATVPATNGAAMDLSTNQTIAGAKTFSGQLRTTAIVQTTSGQTVNIPVVLSTDTFATLNFAQLFTNKTLDTTCSVADATDNTKRIGFTLSGMTTGVTLTLASSQSTSRTLTFPNITAADTVAVLGLAQVMTNKSLDSTCNIVNSVDNTKKWAISNAGMTTGITLTLASSQTTSQTLTFPNITGAATLAVLSLAQTFTAAQTYSGGIINTKAGSTTVAAAGIYSNPATVAMSGANNYFWNHFVAPPTSGSSTGTAATVTIAGAPTTAATNNYAFQVQANTSSFPIGAVGTPSIVFGNSNTSGLYSSGANVINTSISGTNVLTCNSTGLTVAGKMNSSTLQISTGSTFSNVQFGSFTYSTSLAAGASVGVASGVTFSPTFSGTPNIIITSAGTGFWDQCSTQVSTSSTTTFSITIRNNSGSATSGTATISWIAFN